jgi:tetratricopeptide (TPR) repeat protein
MWMALTEYEDALADFNQVLTLDANYVPGYNNRGVLYIVEGELDLALADFDQAISVSGIDGILEELTDPERPSNAQRPEYDNDHAQAYALIGVVRSQQALDNYEAYLLLAGGSRDRRVEAAAGALESRLSFELRVDDGTWLLVAGFGLE